MHDLFAVLDIMVIERVADGSLKMTGTAPEWTANIFPNAVSGATMVEPFEKFSFLDNFTVDAENFWAENRIGRLKSGTFTEVDPWGTEYALKASAICLERKKLLLIELMGIVHEEQTKQLQLARENLLVKEYLEEQVRLRTAEIRQREEEIVYHLVAAAESRDADTGNHVRRIGLYSEAMARELGWSKGATEDIRIAAPMHDVGKIGIPDRILLKSSSLDQEEMDIMRSHTELGAHILGDSTIPLLQMAREISLCHHEKWDGSGYPNGLAGEAIPESARILAVVDVYDALIYERPYKSAMVENDAITKMKEGMGTHFDPRIFDIFLQLLPKFREIQQQFPPDPSPH